MRTSRTRRPPPGPAAKRSRFDLVGILAKPLSLLLSLLFVFHCEPFQGLLHARAFEGSPRGTAEGPSGSFADRPTKQTTRFLRIVGVRDSQVGLFDTPVFTERLAEAIRPALRAPSPDEWDFEGRMVGAASPGEVLTFAYDVDGIRTAKSVNGTLTKFVVDKNRDYAQVLEERDLANTLQVAYIYGDDLISQERGADQKFYHYDGQLSTRQLTDASAQVTDSYTYDSFGVKLASSGTTANHYLYIGEQLDSSLGFYYLRARYMDPGLGRFMAQDPSERVIASDPTAFHKYLYTNHNPISYVDPLGLWSISLIIVVVIVLLILLALLQIGELPDCPAPEELPIPKEWIPAAGDPPGYGPNINGLPEGLPEGNWRWYPDQNNSRGGNWHDISRHPRRTASWEDRRGREAGVSHWDVDDGRGHRARYNRAGDFRTPEQAHHYRPPSHSEKALHSCKRGLQRTGRGLKSFGSRVSRFLKFFITIDNELLDPGGIYFGQEPMPPNSI